MSPSYISNLLDRPKGRILSTLGARSFYAAAQLTLSQAPHGFGAPYRGFPAFLSPSNSQIA